MISDPCPECPGAGRVTEERTLSVNIPAGIEDGTRIRLAGEGEAGLRGGPAGDLYIFLSIKPHEFFQRDGADIFCRVPISVTTAALGGEFEVPTIDGGKTRVKVPDGHADRQAVPPQGQGHAGARAQPQVGDMYIQVVVETPRNLSRRQRELLEEFEKASSAENTSRIDRLLRARPRVLRRLISPRILDQGTLRCPQRRPKGPSMRRPAPLPQGPGGAAAHDRRDRALRAGARAHDGEPRRPDRATCR